VKITHYPLKCLGEPHCGGAQAELPKDLEITSQDISDFAWVIFILSEIGEDLLLRPAAGR
jgi:hypothetical protein